MNLKSMSLWTALVLVSFNLSAQFSTGKYTLKNVNRNTYMAYEADYSDADLADAIGGSMETTFLIQENANNPGKFNILTEDGTHYLRGTGSGPATLKAVADGDLDAEEGLVTMDFLNHHEDTAVYQLVAYGDRAFNGNSNNGVGMGSANQDPINWNYYWWVTPEGGGFVGISPDTAEDMEILPVAGSVGVFKLSKEADYEVYSISGAKVLSGSGVIIDLSSSPQGTYVVRAGNVTDKIMF